MATTVNSNGEASSALSAALAAAGYTNQGLSELATVQLAIANLITSPVFTGATSFAGVVSITNTTQATAGPAGALVVSGGIYSAKKVYSIGDLTVGASTFVVTAATGAVAASGNITLNTNDTWVGVGVSNHIKFNNTTDTITIATGNGVAGLSIVGTAHAATFSGALAITGALTGVTTAAISATASIYGATAAPATAGAAAAGAPIKLYSGLLTIEATTDAPTHTRPKGSLCINTGGSSTTTRLYVNTDGAGTWTPFTTSA